MIALKRLVFLMSLTFVATILWAGQINREQALRRAQQFLSQEGRMQSLTLAETQMSKARSQGKQTPDYYYVFNAGDNQGFVIVSGDDSTPAILGYSTEGRFDLSSMPPAMKALLNSYAAQISLIQQGKAIASPARVVSHLAVTPFMTVQWDQGDPYDGMTPLGYYTNVEEGVHCATGCVATAMAQVLYFQHFVNKTQSTIPGYTNELYWISPSGDKYADLKDIPSGTPLSWNLMVDDYLAQETSQEAKDAVANLMLYCGTAVKMKYDIPASGGSSAALANVPEALKKYFGYSKGTRFVKRYRFSEDEWDRMLYHEVASNRPVIYGGQTEDGAGHAFILHGYDGHGMYAINWGWGGRENGFFLLDDLTPEWQGVGGSSSGQGFQLSHEAVISLSKEDGTFSEIVTATLEDAKVGALTNPFTAPTETEYQTSKTSSGGVPFAMTLKFANDLANVYTFDFGYGITDSSGTLQGQVVNLNNPASVAHNAWVAPAAGTSNFGANLKAGTYYIKAYSRESGKGEWQLCKNADKHVIEITVTNKDMKFKVTDITVPAPPAEVTDEDRADLADVYKNLKSAVEAQQKKVSANEKEIATLKTQIKDATAAAKALNTKITDIEKKIANESLTEEQKKDFTDQLKVLKNSKAEYETGIGNLSDKLATIETDNADLKTRLADALSAIKEQADAIKSITTTSAYDKAIAKAEELLVIANDNAAETVASNIADVKTMLSLLSLDVTTMALTTLEASIDDAILENGIHDPILDNNGISGQYDLKGRPVKESHKGVTIIRMNNGQTKKMIIR